MSKRPALFIGSSSEGLEIARALEVQLQNDAEVTVWNEGIIGPSRLTLESLIEALERFDFAIIVFTGDDRTVSRNVEMISARDNVLIELGLFMGRIGRPRTYVVCDSQEKLKIPSDLAGFSFATYQPNSDGDYISALGPASTIIRNAMRKLGAFDRSAKQSAAKSSQPQCFTIVNKHSEKCLDVTDWSKADGENIQQWDYHGGDNQTWLIRPFDEKYFSIVSKHSGKCLTVFESSLENGASVQQWEYSESDNQHWQFAKVEDGAYQIIAKHSGKCLELISASKENGADLIQCRWHGGGSQRWWIRCVL